MVVIGDKTPPQNRRTHTTEGTARMSVPGYHHLPTTSSAKMATPTSSQKTITSLHCSKENLEEEVDASSSELIKLEKQLKRINAQLGEQSRLEDGIAMANEKNEMLLQRTGEITKVNNKMKGQVKDLVKNLARVTICYTMLHGPFSAIL